MGQDEKITKSLCGTANSYDGQIGSLFDAIRQLMEPPPVKSRRIGFKARMPRKDSRPFFSSPRFNPVLDSRGATS